MVIGMIGLELLLMLHVDCFAAIYWNFQKNCCVCLLPFKGCSHSQQKLQ